MKNIKIKVSNDCVPLIKKEFDYVFPLIRKAEEMVLKMSEWDLFDRDGNQIQNGKEAFSALSGGDKDVEESLRYVFFKLVNSTNYANSAYTLFFGGNRTASELDSFIKRFTKKNSREPDEKERIEIESHVNDLNLRILHYDRLENAKLFPIDKCDPVVGKYILSVLFPKISSVKAQRESCKTNYDLLADLNQKVLLSGFSDLSPELRNNIKQFVKTCNAQKSPVNPKMINYISQQTGDISELGTWTDRDGNSRSYSLNPNIAKFLNSNPEIVTFLKNQKYRTTFYKYVELQEKLRNNKEIPQYTYFRKDSFKIGWDYSGNAPSFEFVNNDEFKSEWKLASMISPKEYITVQCLHRKSGRKNYQLMDLKISEFNKGYNISYKQNGKYSVVGTFTNPSINYKNGNYFINLPVTENIDEKEFRSLKSIQSKLRSAYTESTEDALNDEVHNLITSRQSAIRVMGVDLNLKGIAYTVKEYQPETRTWKYITSEWNSVSNEEVGKYRELSSMIYKTRELLKHTKEAFFHVKSNSSEVCLVQKKNPDLYAFVKSKEESGWNLMKFKTCPEWSVKDSLREVNDKFNALRLDRIKNPYNEMGMFYYAAIVKEVNSLNKSYSTFGTDPNRTNERGINKLKNNTICKHLTDSYENIKIDAEKKFSAYVKNKAVQHGVSIVVVEELSAQSGNKYENTTQQNELNLKWNPGGIKKYLESSLESVGILLEEGSEYLTSQIDPDTKQVGYRDGNFLYVLNKKGDGVIQKNCHIAASENLLDNFVSHYSIPYSFKVTKDSKKEGVYKLDIGKKDLDSDITSSLSVSENTSIEDLKSKVKSEGKRMKYKIFKTFGKTAGKKEFKISNPPTSKKHKEVLTTFSLFNIDGKWVSSVERDAYEENIKSFLKK